MSTIDPRKTFTTGQVAKLLGCAPRTATKYIDSGQLRGYRLPPTSGRGPGDRRVTWAALDAFCREHAIQIIWPYGDPEEAPAAKAGASLAGITAANLKLASQLRREV